MSCRVFQRLGWLVLAPLFLLPLGCGSKVATLTGKVTYDGKPIANGYINFTPTEGQGPSAGGPIKDGAYTVKDVTPGKNKALVTLNQGSSGPKSMGDASNAPKSDYIPPNAVGNNEVVDVSKGSSTHDFTLEKPK